MSDEEQMAEPKTAAEADDPAASMLLLRNIEKFALDPAYRRVSSAEKSRGKKKPWWVQLIVLGIAVALGWGSTVAALNLRGRWSGQSGPRVALSKQVEETQTRVEETEKETGILRDQLRAREVLQGGTVVVPPGVGLASATTRVQGPGVVVTLDDGASSAGTSARIRDQDLREVKNLLWSAGAEALSFDGNRLGPTTSIRSAGSSILVNQRPVSSPYVIEAIGDPATLIEVLQTGEGKRRLEEIGRVAGSPVSVTRSEKLTLSALPLQTTWSVEVLGSKEGDAG